MSLRLQREVHPTGIGAFSGVVALADDLVVIGQVVGRPLREFERAFADDFDVTRAALGVLAGAKPARGLVLAGAPRRAA